MAHSSLSEPIVSDSIGLSDGGRNTKIALNSPVRLSDSIGLNALLSDGEHRTDSESSPHGIVIGLSPLGVSESDRTAGPVGAARAGDSLVAVFGLSGGSP